MLEGGRKVVNNKSNIAGWSREATGETVLQGQMRLLTTTAAVLESPGRLFTTEEAMLEGEKSC